MTSIIRPPDIRPLVLETTLCRLPPPHMETGSWERFFGIANSQNWYYVPFVTTISLKIPDELVSRLDVLARARETSRSALFREALEEKLQTAARKSPPSLYERSADLCGSGASGAGDLASNPRHLDGFGA